MQFKVYDPLEQMMFAPCFGRRSRTLWPQSVLDGNCFVSTHFIFDPGVLAVFVALSIWYRLGPHHYWDYESHIHEGIIIRKSNRRAKGNLYVCAPENFLKVSCQFLEALCLTNFSHPLVSLFRHPRCPGNNDENWSLTSAPTIGDSTAETARGKNHMFYNQRGVAVLSFDKERWWFGWPFDWMTTHQLFLQSPNPAVGPCAVTQVRKQEYVSFINFR
jgi:hypothetical protein